jgi:hypothetical protein
MEIPSAWEKSINVKNQMQKISLPCPFNCKILNMKQLAEMPELFAVFCKEFSFTTLERTPIRPHFFKGTVYPDLEWP